MVRSLSLSSRSSAFLNRAVLLLGTVITFVIVLMVITLMALMDETNRSAASDQMKRLELAMKAELDNAQRELAIVASGQSGRFAGSIGVPGEISLAARFENAWHFFGFDSIYALDSEGDVIIGMEAGAVAGKAGYSLLAPLASRLIQSVQTRQKLRLAKSDYRLSSPGYEQMLGASMLIHDGTGLALASVVPVNRDNPTSAAADIMVAIRNLPDQRLSEIGQRHGLTDLRFRGARYVSTPFALPVRGMDGELIGHIAWTFFDPGSRLLTNLLAIVLAGVLAIIAAFAVLFQRLRKLGGELAIEEETTHRLATRDHLSGLLNRLALYERAQAELERCHRSHGGFALHLIDLDRFKEVNDTLGHEAGDAVIREVARRISERVRGADIVARLGGDEFAVIQVETETTHEAGALASRSR
jgi:diguanylate cyclase